MLCICVMEIGPRPYKNGLIHRGIGYEKQPWWFEPGLAVSALFQTVAGRGSTAG